MLCKKCRGATMVVDSASDKDKVYRARVCKSCSYKFYTSESHDNDAGSVLMNLRNESRRQGRYKEA